MKKMLILLAACAGLFAGCTDVKSLGNGEVYIAGQKDMVCVGTVKVLVSVTLSYLIVLECDDGKDYVNLSNFVIIPDSTMSGKGKR